MLRKSILIGVMITLAAPALASQKRKETCRITADIVAQAVDARIAGKSAAEAKTKLRGESSGITGIYKATIPTLVDMVYGFEETTLGNGAVEQYETECLNF